MTNPTALTVVTPISTKQAVPVESSADRVKRIGATFTTRGMDNYERAIAATAVKLYRDDCGTITPFPQFFSWLLRMVITDVMPSPDEVAEALKEFREDFEMTSKSSLEFLKAYEGRL